MSLIQLGKKTKEEPKYFFQRFENGRCLYPELPRITTEESIKLFPERAEGLRVLLIAPPIRLFSMPNIEPIGQCYIASVALMDGHKVSVLDLNAERKEPIEDKDLDKFNEWMLNRVIEKINEVKPDLIGIGGIITQYKTIRSIINTCKENSGAKIVLGGGIASCLPLFMVERLNVDLVSCEEGELTFSEILYRIENKLSFAGLEGTVFKDENGEIIDNGKRPSVESGEDGLDCLPWPSRSLWDVENTYRKNPVGWLNYNTKWIDGRAVNNEYCLCILGSRGCSYSCDYCYVTYLGKSYRCRSQKDIVDEMEYLKNRYGLTYIHFLDDLYLTNYKWSLEFFEELRMRKEKNNFDIFWGATCRTNIISLDIKRAQKENRKHMIEQAFDVSMRQVCVGIESASPTILKSIDKSGQTQETIAMCVAEVKRIFGILDASFMIGSPNETKETIQETIDFCLKHNIDVETIFYTTAFPGTPFWELANSKQLISKLVRGYKCDANNDDFEKYFELLGENSQRCRTNFSDTLTDEELIKEGNRATQILGSKNKRHPKVFDPHTGDRIALGAEMADL